MIKQIKSRAFVIFIGISGCFSVLFGAWLAHAGSHLSPDIVNRVNTAHHYQVIHTLALLIITVWRTRNESKILLVSSLCFALGILCFSGSLYLKTLLNLPAIGGLAPIGGVLLAIGWLCLVFIGKKS